MTEAFALILKIAVRRGVRDINTLPGCWEFTAGPWSIAVNGHREECATTAGDKVPPFHALAIHGEKVGGIALISLDGGTCADGVEDELCAALRAEVGP